MSWINEPVCSLHTLGCDSAIFLVAPFFPFQFVAWKLKLFIWRPGQTDLRFTSQLMYKLLISFFCLYFFRRNNEQHYPSRIICRYDLEIKCRNDDCSFKHLPGPSFVFNVFCLITTKFRTLTFLCLQDLRCCMGIKFYFFPMGAQHDRQQLYTFLISLWKIFS